MVSQKRAFSLWVSTTDKLCKDAYGITTEDAGYDASSLRDSWRTGVTPKEFAEWFGEKLDLDRRA